MRFHHTYPPQASYRPWQFRLTSLMTVALTVAILTALHYSVFAFAVFVIFLLSTVYESAAATLRSRCHLPQRLPISSITLPRRPRFGRSVRPSFSSHDWFALWPNVILLVYVYVWVLLHSWFIVATDYDWFIAFWSDTTDIHVSLRTLDCSVNAMFLGYVSALLLGPMLPFSRRFPSIHVVYLAALLLLVWVQLAIPPA